jgi:hypothetical protein
MQQLAKFRSLIFETYQKVERCKNAHTRQAHRRQVQPTGRPG